MPRNLLVYRLIVQNILFVAGLIAAWQIPWVQQAWASDDAYVSRAIVGLFLLGLGSTAWSAAWINRAGGEDSYWANTYLTETPTRIEHLHWFAEWCTMMGFFGMVVGFYQALSAMTGAADQQAMAQLTAGIRLSLATTMVGCVCGLWTQVNYLTLKTTAALKAEG